MAKISDLIGSLTSVTLNPGGLTNAQSLSGMLVKLRLR